MAKTQCTCGEILNYDSNAVALLPVRMLMSGDTAEYVHNWALEESPSLWLCPHCGDVRVEVTGSAKMVAPKTPEAIKEWRRLLWSDDAGMRDLSYDKMDHNENCGIHHRVCVHPRQCLLEKELERYKRALFVATESLDGRGHHDKALDEIDRILEGGE